SEYTVAWLAADSPHGYELALKWIKAKAEHTAAAGWSTLSSWMSIKADDELDIATLEDLLDQVANSIHDQPNRVRYAMNGFVIACGSYVAGLTEKAQEVATKIGKVKVEMGGTACKVPLADAYIEKVIKADRIGKKRKMARC
ncbi:MAG: DNA alkylation repair protein, partial [Bacteroidota bacterium]